MDLRFKQRFIDSWNRYFPGAELPITFYYTDEEGCAEPMKKAARMHCLICDLAQVRKGKSLQFDVETIGCFGGKRYLGFMDALMPNFEYFLSCGIPGKMEGERYKKSPELVRELMTKQKPFKAPGRYIIFKRWDNLDEKDEPSVVIFFAPPDVLSGLFTLTSFDETESNSTIAPMGAGCGTIVYYPYHELKSEHPRAILGMFDVSARPCVPPEVLTFSVPLPKFIRMVDNMDESFLTTKAWGKVKERISKTIKR